MTDKIKAFIKTAASYAVKNKKTVVIALAALAALVLVIILVSLLSGGEETSATEWGDGITDGIPAFSGDADVLDIAADGSYGAAYYSDVTTEQVSEYASLLSQECGIEFSSDKYPRSAVYGEKIIVIHYNVTEMRFSVTVTAKTNS